MKKTTILLLLISALSYGQATTLQFNIGNPDYTHSVYLKSAINTPIALTKKDSIIHGFHSEFRKGVRIGILGISLIGLSGLINIRHNALDNSLYYLAAGRIYSKPYNYAFNNIAFSTGLLLSFVGVVIRIDSYKYMAK